jgi:hypothetical protein
MPVNPSQITSNLTAVTNPSVNDDHNHGYRVGSLWLNTALSLMFQCFADTNGAAVWKVMPFLSTLPKGELRMSGNGSATTLTSTNPNKAAGTTSAGASTGFTMPANNKLLYSASYPTLTFEVKISASVSSATINDLIGIVLRKTASGGGTTDYTGTASNTLAILLVSSIQGVGLNTFVTLSGGDYIEVYLQNRTANRNATLVDLTLTLTATP